MSRLPAKDRKLMEKICDRGLTNLPRPKLVSVVATCRAIEEDRIPGSILEVGCALGGSAILIAIAKYPPRPFRIYDAFGTAPAEGEGAGGGPGGDLYEVVLGNLREYGVDPRSKAVTLHKGPIRETLRIGKAVAFVHVNVGDHDDVATCLTRVLPQLSPGGIIILDEYHDQDGCRRAADECFKGIEGRFDFDDSDGSMKITKRAR